MYELEQLTLELESKIPSSKIFTSLRGPPAGPAGLYSSTTRLILENNNNIRKGNSANRKINRYKTAKNCLYSGAMIFSFGVLAIYVKPPGQDSTGNDRKMTHRLEIFDF